MNRDIVFELPDGSEVLVTIWEEESYSPPTLARRGKEDRIWGPPVDAYRDSGAPRGYFG